MKKVVLAAAIAALFSSPALAADKKTGAMKNEAGAKDSAVGRGGLAEWPVSKEEADWSSAAAKSSASSGASSGDSGAGTTNKNK